MKLNLCLRCGHEWVKRIPHPIRCPKCRSPYWDRPRRNPKGMLSADDAAALYYHPMPGD